MRYRISTNGFVLIIVMALIASLSILAVVLVDTTKNENRITQQYANKKRAALLARSGLEKALAELQNNTNLALGFTNLFLSGSLGEGTYRTNGDTFSVVVTDSSGKINVNDGVFAGNRELGAGYDASAIDPYPDGPGGSEDISALINLRGRRLLNAYGDIMILMSNRDGKDLGRSDYGIPYTRAFTSTATADHLHPMPADDGLGDCLIAARPIDGFSDMEQIRECVNAWGMRESRISSSFLSSEGCDSFYDRVTQDLCVLSYEDTSFQRFCRQREIYGQTFEALTSPDESYFQNNPTDCRFNPNYIDSHPYDLSSGLWAGHAVPLINLNSASKCVRAAVFYSPVNVAYTCEGAATHTLWQEDASHPRNGDMFVEKYGNVMNSGMAHASIGVRGPCFRPIRLLENGHTANVQKNRFMSLRDALALAVHYDGYTQSIYGFDDFKKFLTWHREEIIKGNVAEAPDDYLTTQGYSGYGANGGYRCVYERAEPITRTAPNNSNVGTYFRDHVQPLFNRREIARPHKVDPLDTSREVDILWVSQYWKSEDPEDGPVGEWHGGWFLEDYVERALPQILSCTRRIPGFLGAPTALTSPYMIVQPYAYHAGAEFMNSDAGAYGRDHIDLSRYATDAEWKNSNPADNPYAAASNINDWHLARQPKVGLEDLVEKFPHPKVAFEATGFFDLVSSGVVLAGEDQISAMAEIRLTIKFFDRKTYRTQKDFADHLHGDSHPDIVLGPDFDSTPSEEWLACGLADSNSRDAGGSLVAPNADLNQITYYDVFMNFPPGEKLLDHETQVTDSGRLLLDAPTFSNQSLDPWYTCGTDPHRMEAFDLEVMQGWSEGYDGDPFGQGLFLSQNNHGEWASNISQTFTDSLYWNLNNKKKGWDTGAGVYGNYPTGYGFHRGFAAAWFRVPTAYPFAHPVIYEGPKRINSGGGIETRLRDKTQLRRTILSLNLHQKFEYRNFRYANEWDKNATTRLINAVHPVNISVGYYSGFDNYYSTGNDPFYEEERAHWNGGSNYAFEHGLYGQYSCGSRHLAGSVAQPPVASLAAFPCNQDLIGTRPSENFSGRPNEGKRWTYGQLVPLICQYIYDPAVYPETVHWGYYKNTSVICGQDSLGYDRWAESFKFHTSYIGTAPSLVSFQNISFNITHKLPMNTTPECAPGSWHRVYAFWFIRSNPVQGLDEYDEPGVADGTFAADDTGWGADRVSRYYSVEGLSGAETTNDSNRAGAVDGLDQFGIWFRDDSNFSEKCSTTTGTPPTADNAGMSGAGSYYTKPAFERVWDFELNDIPPDSDPHVFHVTSTLPQDPNMYFSVGEMPANRVQHYEPKTGETAHATGTFPDTFHYPAYRLDSTVDNVIFAYGPNISMPSVAGSYFHGLFHTAAWLEAEPEDETRYLPQNQELILGLGADKDIPAGSKILKASGSIFYPQDTHLNFCDVKLEIWNSNIKVAPQTSNTLGHEHFYTSLYATDTLQARFRYADKTPDDLPLIDESTIDNNSFDDVARAYAFDGGDSFTNIPYIQELTVIYMTPGGVEILRYEEN